MLWMKRGFMALTLTIKAQFLLQERNKMTLAAALISAY